MEPSIELFTVVEVKDIPADGVFYYEERNTFFQKITKKIRSNRRPFDVNCKRYGDYSGRTVQSGYIREDTEVLYVGKYNDDIDTASIRARNKNIT